MFGAIIRGRTSAVVVGQESGGRYYGHTSVQYQFPRTGIITQFAIVDLDQDVPLHADQPRGRGVMLDYPVTKTEADFLANRDTQLEFALRLVAERTADKATR